jgi:hypothetical protein
MGYKTIIIDLEELKDIKSGLSFVHEEMSNISDITDRINELVGNPEPDLKGAISDFDGSWDDNRKEIVDSAAKMSEATQHTIEDWNKWDSDAAKAVSPDGASMPASGEPV